MNNSDFKELVVWQKAFAIVKDIYLLIRTLPAEERFALSDQMRRCSISIPSNIAEGHRRNTNKEFMYFLSIARGSVAELQTQLLLCHSLGYSEESVISGLCDRLTEIEKMLSSLMYRLSRM